MSGTITLPSGDKLITQLETLSSGALVHREEVIVSGTISGRLALPTNNQPLSSDYGLPVREIQDPKRVELVNYGHSGTPLRIDPTGVTTQPVSLASLPSVSFSGPQPISSVAGTVQVAFTPSAVQSVNLLNVGFAGTPLRIDPTGTTTQPVSLAGTLSIPDYARYSEQQTQTASLGLMDDIVHAINAALGKVAAIGAQRNDSSPTVATEGSIAPPRITSQRGFHVNLRNEAGQELGTAGTPLRFDPTGTTTQPVSISGTLSIPDYARYSEQLTQSSRLSSIDTDVLSVTAAVIGTPAVKFASPQQIIFSGQQPVHGTVVVSSLPSVTVASLPNITFAAPQPISTVAGTVSVTFPSAQSVTFPSQQPVHGTVVVSSIPSITFASAQPISTISGTISLPDYARYSEQLTQSSRLNSIDTDILATTAAIKGTQAVTIFGTPSVSISGIPAVTFSGAQPISTVAGTVAVTFPSAQSVNITNTPAVTFSGQQPIHGTVVISSIPSITFASAQPISTVAGTVAVSFTPVASQNVILTTPVAAGTTLSRYDEQQTQTTALQLIDDVVHSANAAFSKVAAIGGQVDDISITLGTENTISPVRITPYRAQHVSLRNEVGVEIGSAGTPLRFDPTGTTTQPVSNTVLSVVGGGAEATAQRVTIANDSTGVLSIDDNGGNISIDDGGNSITVDGQVNVLLQNYGHSGTPLRVDPTGVTTQPVSWSGVPTVSIPGTITANIRNNIFTHKTARVEISATGNNTVVSSVTGKRIKIYSMSMNTERAGTVSMAWMDGTLPISGTQMFIDREGFTLSVSPPSFLIAPQSGTAVVVHVPTPLFTGGMRGWVSYWDDDQF